jgi:hypothetical protein
MTTEIQKIEPQTGIFASTESFELAQRQAKMLCASDMVPKAFQGQEKIGNCVIALEMAGRIGMSPFMVMQNVDVIHGKPGWSSKFLIACFNACGKFSPIEYEEDGENGGRTRAKAKSLETGEYVFGPWVSMDMAKAEGWSTKAGSKWKTIPELMLRYRAAAFFIRTTAPEVSMGLHTQEEIRDTNGMRNATPQVRTEPTDPFADTQQDTLELNTETAPAVDEDFNNS